MAVVKTCRWGPPVIGPTIDERARIRRCAETAWPTFVENGWTYGWDRQEVPDVDELEQTITRLYESVSAQPHNGAYSSSGRFVVLRVAGKIRITLELNARDLG